MVTAHPDDVDFGAAGTVAAWRSAGIEVAYLVCTSGEAAGEPEVPRAEIAETRRAEQRAAASVIGVERVTFLDHPDGALTPSIELRRDITRAIREFRPDRVLTWSPEINWEMVVTTHPDHRATGEAAFAAVYPDARNPNAHPELLRDEGLRPWTVRELWLADGPPAARNHAVDVTDTFAKKIEALRQHRSQVGTAEGLEENLRQHLSRAARRHGLPVGHLAEVFQVVDTN